MIAPPPFRFADVALIAARFPPRCDTRLMDAYLRDADTASVRLFRLYDDLPPHFHAGCDELLFLVAGRCRVAIGGEAPREIGAGELVVFGRAVVHALSPVGEAPVVFLTADTPRRDPADVRFTDAPDKSGKPFVSHLAGFEPGRPA